MVRLKKRTSKTALVTKTPPVVFLLTVQSRLHCCSSSLFMRTLFHIYCFAIVLFLVSPSFGAQGRLCFVIVAFPGIFTYIHLNFFFFFFFFLWVMEHILIYWKISFCLRQRQGAYVALHTTLLPYRASQWNEDSNCPSFMCSVLPTATFVDLKSCLNHTHGVHIIRKVNVKVLWRHSMEDR